MGYLVEVAIKVLGNTNIKDTENALIKIVEKNHCEIKDRLIEIEGYRRHIDTYNKIYVIYLSNEISNLEKFIKKIKQNAHLRIESIVDDESNEIILTNYRKKLPP